MSKCKEGTKYDSGKLRWDLLPFEALEEIVEVLTVGAAKYSPDNWKKVDDFNNRYFAAAMRHLVDWKKGEPYDMDLYARGTKVSHLACAGANILFLLWKEKAEKFFYKHGITDKEDLDNA